MSELPLTTRGDDAIVVSLVDLHATLQQHFGHASFRAGQEDLVRAVVDGHDVLAVMPTGSGKSLGFQLPSLLLPGTTLVVSPLISLMKDQVDELNRRAIRAAALHSMLSSDVRQQTLHAAQRGEIRLLYVAPERFASDHFLRTLSNLPVARFVVDEAHCVSEWGHDFRPDYRRLKDAAARCRRSDGQAGRPPIAAFTATATPEVRDDIVDLLGLARPRVVVAGFDRPNIELRVRPVAGDLDKQQMLPELVGQGRTLVYAATRKKAEAAAATLQSAGVGAAVYHAGLPDAERGAVQDRFASGALRVVCATNAFGMGIDRPDVESVVHVDIPGSLEAYYQEIGRAGRDGRPAIATLLWNYADVRTREFLIDRDRDDPGDRPAVRLDPAEIVRRKTLEHQKLRRMVAYADTTGCLRATILRYFGDPATREACEACSNCRRRASLDADARLLVRKILSGIARAGERYGRRKIVAMLVGHTDDVPEALTRLSTTGLLDGEQPTAVERWIDSACGAGLIHVSNDEYRTLSLTPLGREVMAGRVDQVQMAMPIVRPARSGRRAARSRGRRKDGDRAPSHARARQSASTVRRPSVPSPSNGQTFDKVFAALRAWRTDRARERAVAPFIVMHDRTLAAIATSLPRSIDDLSDVPGIGPAKLSADGDAILSVIAAIVTAADTP
jgi:ATP-dependent DNA helicase RecQ